MLDGVNLKGWKKQRLVTSVKYSLGFNARRAFEDFSCCPMQGMPIFKFNTKLTAQYVL